MESALLMRTGLKIRKTRSVKRSEPATAAEAKPAVVKESKAHVRMVRPKGWFWSEQKELLAG